MFNSRTRTVVKFIAIVTMLIDHVGLFIFPGQVGFRIIGRTSFPLFVALIADGASRSRDKKKYALRLVMLAVVSQAAFVLFQVPQFKDSLNILFTFAIMILLSDHPGFLLWIAVLIDIIAPVVRFSYGGYGILGFIFIDLFTGKKQYNQWFRKLHIGHRIVIAILAFLGLHILYWRGIRGLPIFNQGWAMFLGWFPATITMMVQGDKRENNIVSEFNNNDPVPVATELSANKRYYNKALQVFSYLFYPIHVLLLYALSFIM